MARPDSLIPGNCYLLVHYYDDDLLVPDIQTYIFTEKIVDDDGRDLWLFSEPVSTATPEDASEEADAPMILAIGAEQLYAMLDIRALGKLLSELYDLHPIVSADISDTSSQPGRPRADFSDLAREIGVLLNSEDYWALTITILYTDDGFSLGRRDGQSDASFHIHWKINPEKEQKIRALFEGMCIDPKGDYLANKGRVRMLSYPLPPEETAMVDVAVRVLNEVYGIRESDELKFFFHSAVPGA